MGPKVKKNIRIAYLVSHPIQYQIPLLRKIAKDSRFNLTVFFRSDFSTKEFKDPDFGRQIKWDTNLLDGYHYDILPLLGRSDIFSFWRPLNYGLWKRLRNGNFDILWIHGYGYFFHLYAVIVAKLLGIKVLLRDEATTISKKRGVFNKTIKKIFFNFLNLLAAGFLAIGKMNKNYYLANGVPKTKIFEMPYAVDNLFFQNQVKFCSPKRELLRASLGLLPGRPIVLYVSKMSQRKKPIDLLEAFINILKKTKPRPYLLFVGDGEMRYYLEKRVSKLGLVNDVLFLGFKNQGELPRFYDLCDLFVLPSVFEPWGLVINEAMNASKAVIASDMVGSSLDLIHSGINGYVFKSGDVSDLAAIMKVTLSDPFNYIAMGKNSLDIISRWGYAEDIQGLKRAVDAIV
jgi:glycosyltransferase involved in cell wall biosynthesis